MGLQASLKIIRNPLLLHVASDCYVPNAEARTALFSACFGENRLSQGKLDFRYKVPEANSRSMKASRKMRTITVAQQRIDNVLSD